jgi:hydroxypyruvate isomerase
VTDDLSRREAISALAVLSLAPHARLGDALLHSRAAGVAGKFKQSVSRWCYGRIPLDDLCESAKAIGYSSVELLSEPDWATP